MFTFHCSVTKQRTEIIIQGTTALDPSNPTTEWKEYQFFCKPGEKIVCEYDGVVNVWHLISPN